MAAQSMGTKGPLRPLAHPRLAAQQDLGVRPGQLAQPQQQQGKRRRAGGHPPERIAPVLIQRAQVGAGQQAEHEAVVAGQHQRPVAQPRALGDHPAVDGGPVGAVVVVQRIDALGADDGEVTRRDQAIAQPQHRAALVQRRLRRAPDLQVGTYGDGAVLEAAGRHPGRQQLQHAEPAYALDLAELSLGFGCVVHA
jgi:hypothetical protein